MSFRTISPNKKKRVHIGHHFYGAGNIGDDLMLAGFLACLKHFKELPTLTCSIPFDRSIQQARYPEITWLPYDRSSRELAIRNCSVWLGLGGSTFETDTGDWMLEHMRQELELCKKYRKPMFFLSVGVNNNDALQHPCYHEVLDYAECFWTRGEAAYATLLEAFPADKFHVGGDLSNLFLSGVKWPEPRVNSLGWIIHVDNQALIDTSTLAGLIERMDGMEQFWLVQEIRKLDGSELFYYDRLRGHHDMPLCVPDYAAASTELLLQNWPACSLVITSRFHGTLISAWRGVPLVVLERNDKLKGIASALGCASIRELKCIDSCMHAIELARPVERRILEQHTELAWRSCAEWLTMAGIIRRHS